METDAEKQPEPVKPIPTLDALRSCGYDAILEQSVDSGYVGMNQQLANAARAAEDDGDSARAGALRLLAEITSMMLTPEDKSAPYRPLVVLSDGRRTMIPDDLSLEAIDLIAELAHEVKNHLLRARLGDLIWMRARKKGIAFAHMAIDAYRLHPIDHGTWNLDGASCWHRALQLSLLLGKGGGTLSTEIEAALLAAFWKATDFGTPEALWYVRPLYAQKCASGEAGKIAAKFEEIAGEHEASARLQDAFHFFERSADWYERARQSDKQAEMLARIAGVLAAQGDANSAALARHHFYTKAIAAFREVPVTYRAQHGVDTAIDTLRAKLAVAGSKALGEMQAIRGPVIDLSDATAQAIRLVQGKPPFDALVAFCHFHPLPNQANLLKKAEELLAQSLTRQLFSSVGFADDGRAVTKRDRAMDGADAHAAAVKSGATKACVEIAAMTAHSMIEPALDTMQLESFLLASDFFILTTYSPLVPRDRVELVAKGLFAGYCRDYEQAIHILVPQFEHMVRMALKGAGSHTTTHDADGIDMEAGLSTLVDRPQMVEVFGEDATFTIRSIMCEQEGPNLRNAVAHGLANSEMCNGKHSVYAWWLILRLVTQSYMAAWAGDTETEDLSGDGSS